LTTQIETTKGYVLAVKLGRTSEPIDYADYRLISEWSYLTEEQAAMIVELSSIGIGWYNYNYPDTKDAYCKTALESFTSLMHANGLYLVNPYEFIPNDDPDNKRWPNIVKLANEQYKKYQENTGEHLILFKAK
jgi:hypothetical protein